MLQAGYFNALRVLALAGAVLCGMGAAPAGPPSAAGRPAADSACASTPCRAASRIFLSAGPDTQMFFDSAASPYLTGEGHIFIDPGEKLVFQFAPAVDAPGALQFVRAEAMAPIPPPDLNDPRFAKLDKTDAQSLALAAQTAEIEAHGTAEIQLKDAPPGTFVVTYRQIPGGTGMILSMAHNLAMPLRLKAFTMQPRPGTFALVYTSTCPIPPKLFSSENWPGPLAGIILEGFEFVPQGGDMSCH